MSRAVSVALEARLLLTARPEPASIRVTPFPSGSVTTVPFNTYVEDVLPNEWPSGYGWPRRDRGGRS